jgi:integrase
VPLPFGRSRRPCAQRRAVERVEHPQPAAAAGRRAANAHREQAGRMLLPARVTPHTLRRTWAMLALTAGRDARWVMAQTGHTGAR